MGEIAEAMLDGTLCEGCGEYLGSDIGFPQYCSSCRSDEESDRKTRLKIVEQMQAKALMAITKAIEKEFGAVFCPAVYKQFSSQVMGITRDFYINDNGAITSIGLEKTIINNRNSMKAAAMRKAKNSNRPKDEKTS